MTGCEFARVLSGKAARVAVEVRGDDTAHPAAWLNGAFDQHAMAGRAGIAVFPEIASERGLVELLNQLAEDPRWSLRQRPKPSTRGGVLVSLEWQTPVGDASDTMGFAPFVSMPVPRRAPYVAIATWPGRPSNPFRGQGSTPAVAAGRVSFLDAVHDLEQEAYDAAWARTIAKVATLMTTPSDDARLYRRATFVLSAEAAAELDVSSA